MKMLISRIELDSKGSRDLIPLECLHCKNTHYRTKNIVLRVLNGNQASTLRNCFCSEKCKNNYRKSKVTCQCKHCGSNFERHQSDIGKNVFCGSSCSAKFNNHKRMIDNYKNNPDITIRLKTINNVEKIMITKKCICCNKTFSPSRKFSQKFCSQLCSAKHIHNKIYEQIANGEVNGHSSNTLRNYLIFTRGCKCEICGLTEWQGHPLTVIMDHINGNSNDNTLSNLRLICSNCDTLTPTYKSKNKGNGRHYRRIRYLEGKSF